MLKFPLQYLLLIWTCVGLTCGDVFAQEYPEIPNSLSFAGINVKLDPGAKRIVESDVRSLMANRRYWEDKLNKAVLYFPIIEGVLIEEEVPIDFKYLAVQESSLSADAVSTSNAVGFWQFKQETAQEFGIRVDNEIDERKSISASTHAAAKYLKRSNKQYNNWVSALYSYYLGMGGISQIVPADWSYARQITLDAKTDRYVLRFFAHKIALEAALDHHRTTNAIVLLESPLGKGRHFDDIAADLGINALELRNYNRWVNGDQIPADKDYMLTIPVATNQINVVREKLAMGPSAARVEYAREDIGFPVLRKASVQMRGRNDHAYYEINGLPGIQARQGDKPATLAKAAKISVSSFLRYNDMSINDPIVTNEIYYLASKNKKAIVPFHTVREGETLRGISQTYGMRLRELMKYNRITNRNLRLQTGRVMWLMKKRPNSQPVEIINTPGPGKSPVQDTKPAPVTPAAIASNSEIPQTAADRKKYTPKLADTSYPSEASPAASLPATGRVSTSSTATSQASTSAPQQASTTKTESAPAAQPGVYQPSRSETVATKSPATTSAPASAGSSGDRIVIISEEDRHPTATSTSNSTSTSPGTSSGTSTVASTNNTASDWGSDVSTPRSRPVSTSTSPVEARPVATAPNAEYHTVANGQTYFSISKMYNLSVKNLLSLNNLTSNDKLYVGQRLQVKQSSGNSSSSTTSTTPARTAPAGNEYQFHTVMAGETLFRISQNYQASIEEIKELNHMKDNTVKVGQKVKIPKR